MQRLTKHELQTLRSLHHKEGRTSLNWFLVEGQKCVDEALQTKTLTIHRILSTESIASKYHTEDLPVTRVAPSEMERISTLKTPTNVLAVCEIPPQKKPVGRRILCLDGIQDPGNLGSILRIADWFGIPEIVISNGSADCFNPKVIQASMGSIFRVAVFYTSLSEYLGQVALPVYGAMMEGHTLEKLPAASDGVLIIGSEGSGISDEVLPYLTERITIPRFGKAESLNAAIACGILCAKWCGI